MDKPWVYIVLFGLLLIVYAKIMPKNGTPAAKRDEHMLSDVEATMDHFATELEEQNKALIQMFGDTKKEYELYSAKLASRVELLEKQNDRLQGELSRIGVFQEQLQNRDGILEAQPEASSAKRTESAGQAASLLAAAMSEPRAEAAEPADVPLNIRDRYRELLQLYEQGKSTEFIARKLQMNKGEINLILQLAKQEERSHAQ
ncbi:DUF6115 domain-containing protein [Paenibacillus allorhizosphaerae]|uniref:Uncharacterized protein n=1 Tax=Paenibacillus allorhizosphaerae TaxID=2849866 RepID=A0ABM8VCY3_9BACL|nr:hypothetical protein [Paenibacillus allorhizosphaerae]CAG7623789.1 hypothetical protein PAECIP111802_00987 [Paenibacillus allorhizosphaerae]